MRQLTEIKFETEETILLRQGSAIVTEYCPGCLAFTGMAIPQAAAMIAEVSEREIFRLIEDGKVHFIEKGIIFICVNSLAAIKGEIKQ